MKLARPDVLERLPTAPPGVDSFYAALRMKRSCPRRHGGTMQSPYALAAVWFALAFGSALISARTGIAVALVEILAGVAFGNVFHLQATGWIDFLAGFGSGLLTFLAGAEIEPATVRKRWKEVLSMGLASFLLPFGLAVIFARVVAGWSWGAAEIAGIALSTTSVAVVYAVMVDTGFNETKLGRVILAACFATDLGTVLALGLLFAHYNWYLVAFIVATAIILPLAPRLVRLVIRASGGRMSEGELKFVLVIMFGLGAIAEKGGSEPILPAYLVGMVLAGTFLRERALVLRLRAIAFTVLTPFYFIRAGTYVSARAIVGGAGIIVVFLLVKMASKFAGVRPLARLFSFPHREAMYTTLLMSTGLTFGTISALFGLTHGVIGRDQYTVLVTVVILSAFVPTLLAQQFFCPRLADHVSTVPEAASDAEIPQTASPAPE
jgi:Kef-type K+ transport system membrane component KefB